MQTDAELVRRLAQDRPGYELVSYRDVALPLFQVTIQVLVLEEKAIPPIQEFVLRSVGKGLGDLGSIAGVLGLDEHLVRTSALDLMGSDDLVLKGDGDSSRLSLALTNKGAKTASTAEQTQAIETELVVYVDGLTRQVVSVTGKGLRAFPLGQAENRGLVPIPPHPRKKPELTEVPFESVNAIIASERAGRRARRELIGVVGLGKTRRMARQGLALAFRSESSGELQVNLVVDGKLSDMHDAALSRSQRFSKGRLSPTTWTPALSVIAEELPEEVIAQAPPVATTEVLALERDEIVYEQRRLRTAGEPGTQDELEALRQLLAEKEQREKYLLEQIAAYSVRHVPVYEHAEYLDRALREASSRVMIISPWIKGDVVDSAMLSRFRKLLDRDRELWIGYGFGNEKPERSPRSEQAKKRALNELRRMAEQYPRFHFARLGDTHAKVLICDSRFAVVGSFNWLSFKGDPSLNFRDERSMYVGIPETVNDVFDSYSARFESE